jgi:uracil-DNA glycosylase family 4
MIVGQDWGPYIDIKKYNSRYKKLVNEGEDKETAWKNIVNEKESKTKFLMTGFLIRSAKRHGIYIDEKIMESCFVTNAVLCARKGKNYRGTNNFAARFCTENCAEILNKQINVIEPLVVITLGYWSFYSICKNHNIPIFKTLKENISHYSLNNENIINISHENKPIYVLPAYHPVAQVKKKDQISVYEVVWEILLRYYSRDNLINELNTYKYRRGDLGL